MMEPNMNPGDGNGETVMVPKTLCPGMEFKPGDEMVLKVKSVKGDMLEMEYAPEHSDESHMMDEKEMEHPSEDMKSMSSDKMREKLPKADREGY